MDKFINLADRQKSHATNFIAADRVKQHNQSCTMTAENCFVAPATLS